MNTLLTISVSFTFLWTIQYQSVGRASCFVFVPDAHERQYRQQRINSNTKYVREPTTTVTNTIRCHPFHLWRMDTVHQPLRMIPTTTTTTSQHHQQQQTNNRELELVHTTTTTPDETTSSPPQKTNQNAPSPITTTTEPPIIIPSTIPHAIRVFFFGTHKGPLVILTLLLSLLFHRTTMIMMQPINAADYITASLSILFWTFQEHFIHGRLLHSTRDWIGKDIHHAHHEEPYFHISIDSTELLVGWMGAAYLIFRMILPSLPLATSATIGYATAGMWYEWTHYLVHTKVRPKSKFASRVRDGHMKHHLVNEEYWLGFTVPFVDDLFGTNPSVREAREEKKSGGGGKASRRRRGKGGGVVRNPVVAP